MARKRNKYFKKQKYQKLIFTLSQITKHPST